MEITLAAKMCLGFVGHQFATSSDLNKIKRILFLHASRSSYTAQGLQKQPEILERLLVISSAKNESLIFGTWISDSRSLEPVPVRRSHVDFRLAITNITDRHLLSFRCFRVHVSCGTDTDLVILASCGHEVKHICSLPAFTPRVYLPRCPPASGFHFHFHFHKSSTSKSTQHRGTNATSGH